MKGIGLIVLGTMIVGCGEGSRLSTQTSTPSSKTQAFTLYPMDSNTLSSKEDLLKPMKKTDLSSQKLNKVIGIARIFERNLFGNLVDLEINLQGDGYLTNPYFVTDTGNTQRAYSEDHRF